MHKDIWLYGVVIVFFTLLGWTISYALEFALLAAFGVIAWLMYSMTKLQRWVDNPKEHRFNREFGQTYRMYRQILRKNQQNQRRKRRLTSVISEFRQAVSALPDTIIVVDQNGKINWANANAAKLLGIHWPDDAGVRFNDLLREPQVEALLNASMNEEKLSTPSTLQGIEIKSRLNPNVTISMKFTKYTQKMTMVIARDVSRLIKVNQIHTDFVTNVSHELKTPLTVLKGYVEILSESDKMPSDFDKPLEQMKLQGTRMQVIVDDLLYLARLENKESVNLHESVDVPTLLNAIIKTLQPLIEEKQHTVELDLEPNLFIKGAQAELHSAFSNLITNAIHYTPNDGSIEIKWRLNNQGARLCVIDNGLGIAPQHLDRITQRFYRIDTDRSRESGGTGLGLAIVKHVLQRHDSELIVDSTENKGSRFSCQFSASSVIDNKLSN